MIRGICAANTTNAMYLSEASPLSPAAPAAPAALKATMMLFDHNSATITAAAVRTVMGKVSTSIESSRLIPYRWGSCSLAFLTGRARKNGIGASGNGFKSVEELLEIKSSRCMRGRLSNSAKLPFQSRVVASAACVCCLVYAPDRLTIRQLSP